MSNFDNENQIKQILNIDKLFSLSFPGIAFLQYYTSNNKKTVYFLDYGFLIITVLAAIIVIYSLWNFIQSKLQKPIRVWVDSGIQISISLVSIILTGSYESNYKFLFLFVIIASSIESSRKISLIISSFCTAMILGIDIILSPASSINSYFESDIVLSCVFIIISWTIGYYVDLRKKNIEILKNQANKDGLTGLNNHRCFYDYLDKVFLETDKNKTFSLLFIDLDDFKYYNDLYGHQNGDEVLKTISTFMIQIFPEPCFVARYGGEEFVVLIPDIKQEKAIEMAEVLRNKVLNYHFQGEENLPSETLTISIGISNYPTSANNQSELIKNADEACYRAKFLYKNRVETYYSVLEAFQNNTHEIDRETITSIKTLIAVINAKDKYTYGHVERVVFYCTLFANKMNFSSENKKKLVYAAYLHDIGKINIPKEILIKTEPLSKDEWELLKTHPKKAEEIICKIDSLKDMIPIVVEHHEKFDGTGYPTGLKGNEIHPLARVLTVIDSFDAMTSNRPYQSKKTTSQAIAELKKYSGTQFDPIIASEFIDAISSMTTLNSEN